MKDTTQILREKGLKVTPQRMAIFEMLVNTKNHPSAEMIYKALEPTNPTMSLATVYKTLDSFENVHLIQELNVGEGCSRYDYEIKSHPHFVCKCCGNVFDIDLDLLTDIKETVESAMDCSVEKEQLFLYGVCAQCGKKESL